MKIKLMHILTGEIATLEEWCLAFREAKLPESSRSYYWSFLKPVKVFC